MRDVGVLVIHGMGSQNKGFSNGLVDELNRRLKEDKQAIDWQEIHWSDLLKSREDMLWECSRMAKEPDGTPIELDWNGARRFVIHNFGDALAYQRDLSHKKSAYTLVHATISAQVVKLKTAIKPKAPILVLAHSLGAHMISNYIWDAQNLPHGQKRIYEDIPTLLGFITFGCNIPLFSLAFPVAKPIHIPGPGVKKQTLKVASKWMNFVDSDDILGWPVKPLYQKNYDKLNAKQKRTVMSIEDYEINVGGVLTSWNPAAHGRYWTDNDLTVPVAAYIKSVARSL